MSETGAAAARSGLLLLAALIALSLFAFAFYAYPVPSSDSHAFLPPALLLEAGQGLRNPTSELTRRLDPSGQARYLQYPPLFQLVLALLMPGPTPRAAFLAIAAINALSAFLSALLFARAAGLSARPPSRGAALAACGGLLGLATLLVGQQTGRPEALATLWVLLSAHLHLSRPPERAWLKAGLLLGLLGATHPMGGLILGLLTAAWYGARLPAGRAFAATAGTLALSLAVFSAILAAGPHGLRETLEGLRQHAAITVVERTSRASLVPYWITASGATFYGLSYLLLAGGLAARAVRGQTLLRRPLVLAALIPLGVVVWRVGLWLPELSYNLLLFAPLVFAANVRWSALPATLLAHALAAVGYLRFLVLFGFFLAQGTPLEEAREAFRRQLPASGRVGVTPSLWPVSEEYDRMMAFPLAEGAAHLDADVLFVQQNYSGLLAPPELPGFRLVEDRFLPHSCRLLGVKVANTVPGYAYAVYRRAPERR